MHKWILLNPGKSATPTDVKRYIDYVKEVIARATGESPLEVDPHQTGAYYSEQGHARGRWVGSWAHTLGLEGRPTDQELELMMLGQNPNTGERFWDDGKKPDNLALEILFTVPKSLSIYWDTCGDPWIRQEIERCIWDAYESSSKLLEDKILPLRRGHAGHRHIASEGLATAAFLHTGSRDGDMHLHIHGVTSIFSQGLEDGQISALHTGNLSKTNMTKLVGYAGEAELRHLTNERLGLVWGETHQGIADIVGVDRDLIDHFSKRTEDIEDYLGADAKFASREEWTRAQLDSRDRKDLRPENELRADRIKELADEFGLTPDELFARIESRGLQHQREHHEDAKAESRRISQDLVSPTGLTERQAHFGTEQFYMAALERFSSRYSMDEIIAWADRFLDTHPEISGVWQLSEADDAFDSWMLERHTTKEMDGVELVMESSFRELMARRGSGLCDPTSIRDALDNLTNKGLRLNNGQMDALIHATTSGMGVTRVTGLAGSGKSTLVGACTTAWQANGFRVIGVSTSAKAAEELNEKATMDRRCSLAKLLWDLDHGQYWEPSDEFSGAELDRLANKRDHLVSERSRLAKQSRPSKKTATRIKELDGKIADVDYDFGEPGTKLRPIPFSLSDRDVIVIDENSMTESRHYARITKHIADSGAKVVKLGDNQQLSAVGAGGGWDLDVDLGGVVDLDETVRANAEWERRAQVMWHGSTRWDSAVDGKEHAFYAAKQALQEYLAHGRVNFYTSREEVQGITLQQWLTNRDQGFDIPMLAHRRNEVHDLNLTARRARIERGELADDARRVEAECFERDDDSGRLLRRWNLARGDDVIFCKNQQGIPTSFNDEEMMGGILNAQRGVVERVSPTDGTVVVRVPLQAHDPLVQASPDAPREKLVTLDGNYVGEGNLRLGYCSTVHKSQGATHDRSVAIADWASDKRWLYVAMTRARDGAFLNFVYDPDSEMTPEEQLERCWILDRPELSAIAMRFERPTPDERERARTELEQSLGHDPTKEEATARAWELCSERYEVRRRQAIERDLERDQLLERGYKEVFDRERDEVLAGPELSR